MTSKHTLDGSDFVHTLTSKVTGKLGPTLCDFVFVWFFEQQHGLLSKHNAFPFALHAHSAALHRPNMTYVDLYIREGQRYGTIQDNTASLILSVQHVTDFQQWNSRVTANRIALLDELNASLACLNTNQHRDILLAEAAWSSSHTLTLTEASKGMRRIHPQKQLPWQCL